VLYGALVGGPDRSDAYADNRGDYIQNEVATDYNAGFTGALARMYGQYGGTPLANFPQRESVGEEFSVKAALNASGNNFSEIKLLIGNTSGWPARASDKLTLRYFFTLESGVSPSMIRVSAPYNQCGKAPTGPFQVSGSLYYVLVDCRGTTLAPSGPGNYQKEVQLRITSSGAWNASNDWSAAGLAPSGATPTNARNIVLYDNTTRVFGQVPGSTPPQTTPTASTPTATPRTPTASTATATPRTPTATAATATPRTPTPSPTTPPVVTPVAAVAACSVRYAVQNDWGSGFVAEVIVTNRGAAPIDGWRLGWSFGGNQRVVNGWNGVFSQTGASVAAANPDWARTIAAGASATVGFQAEYSGNNASPTGFTLNGVPCSAQ
jgi:endoglucanase